MASLEDMFDAEVYETLFSEAKKQEDSKPKANPFESIEKYTPQASEDTVLFSKVFWKPKAIPDIPLPLFSLEDWDEAARPYIPSENPDWVWNREVTEHLVFAAIYCKDTTLLHGLQGTGKSCLIQQVAAKLLIPFWRQSCNRETRETHFLGSPGLEYDAEGKMHIKQEPTMLTESLQYGGIFCEDEAFRHNAALVLQSLREKTNRTVTLPDAAGRTAADRILKAPDNKWFYVLTDNTTGGGDTTGIFDAEVQDASTLDRIDASIEVPYLNKNQEKALVRRIVDLDDEVIDGLVTLASNIRDSFRKGELLATMSARGLSSWAQKTEMLGSIGDALKLSWYNKLNPDDQSTVNDMFHQVFGMKL